jgi:hypothetical protein
MLCNTSRTGLPAECHVFTIEPEKEAKATVIGGFWLKWHEKVPVSQQVTVIPLLLNNKPFSSSNLYRIPHCTGIAMYIYYVLRPRAFCINHSI